MDVAATSDKDVLVVSDRSRVDELGGCLRAVYLEGYEGLVSSYVHCVPLVITWNYS